MGHLAALDMAQHAPLETALHCHLRSNHYPPHPTWMIPVAKAAIEAADDLDWNREIPLPQGCSTHRTVHDGEGNRLDDTCELEPAVTWRDGGTTAPAGEIVESFHLNAFLGATMEDDD